MRNRLPASVPRRAAASPRRHGEPRTSDFLGALLNLARERLPGDLQRCQTRQQWSLAKLWYDDPLIHYEVWLHRARGRVEIGLHFETRDPERNARQLEYVAEDLVVLKATLGEGLEAEPWEKGWTRLYLTLPLEPLLPAFQQRLAALLAAFVETLEPLRRRAVDATGR